MTKLKLLSNIEVEEVWPKRDSNPDTSEGAQL